MAWSSENETCSSILDFLQREIFNVCFLCFAVECELSTADIVICCWFDFCPQSMMLAE